MSEQSEKLITAGLLQEWGLPDPGDSKKSRGRTAVVGGSLHSPGGALLAGEAALRVGAGHLALVVPDSIAGAIGTVFPEAGVHALPHDPSEPLTGRLRDQVSAADAVVVGPGFDHADETRATVLAIAAATGAPLLLDAFALGVLPGLDRDALPETLVLTPNREEAAILLGGGATEDDAAAAREIARRYHAVVSCYGAIADPAGGVWRVDGGGPGLGTSGSGDVLAGAVAGFLARGVEPSRAAVWGTWTHARAGDRLTGRMGLGFLARELARELPAALAEIWA